MAGKIFIRKRLNRLLKISQLLRRYKKFKLLRMDKYAATLNYFCSLHLEFLNSLPNKDFFNTLLRLKKVKKPRFRVVAVSGADVKFEVKCENFQFFIDHIPGLYYCNIHYSNHGFLK